MDVCLNPRALLQNELDSLHGRLEELRWLPLILVADERIGIDRDLRLLKATLASLAD